MRNFLAHLLYHLGRVEVVKAQDFHRELLDFNQLSATPSVCTLDSVTQLMHYKYKEDC